MTTLALPRRADWRRPGRRALVAAVLGGWVVLAVVLQDRWTLALAQADLTPLHEWINEVRDAVGANRDSNPLLVYVVEPIRVGVGEFTELVQGLIAQPSYGRPVPVLGWLGVVAVMTYLAAVIANVRIALLTTVGLTFLGVQGLWQESMDTLALTLAAVLLSVVIGVPIGIAAGLSNAVNRVVTPVLDVMQTMPSLAYLAPLTLFFLIGAASATIVTLIFAMPPIIRYTAHGIRAVPETSVEAATSLGATGRQRLTGVLLPMSRRTIVLGLNQTTMAALAMVTVAALINAPGLGNTVLNALESIDVGTAFNAGLAIVVLAIILDRATTAASRRAEAVPPRRSPRATLVRRLLLAGGAALTLFAVYLSRTYLWAAEFPDRITLGGREREITVGSDIARAADAVTTWVTSNLSRVTNGLKDITTSVLIDPLQTLLTASPWWLVVAVVVALAAILGNRGAAVTAAGCLALVAATGLWQDAMETLAATLVATTAVVVLGLVFGVWMGRSRRVDAIIRPTLDAAQVMPAFVYLVPFLALFSPTRFTAIAAAVVYAAPVSIKVIADGVAAVPITAVESATVAGSSAWQTITKVQLPMARESLTLAVNQGLCYVLSMVVLGALVGAGALGYDVLAGFSQSELFGKGLAAGVAIVLLGIMLDRITRAAADRSRPGRHGHGGGRRAGSSRRPLLRRPVPQVVP
jgi:glycine betaine/proline transport system permease protein